VSDESPRGVAKENDVTPAGGRQADGASTPVVTVRYWAAARAAAGVESEQVSAGTLAEAVDEAVRRHDGDQRLRAVLDMCSVLVGEVPVGRRDRTQVGLDDGALVEFLPPFAGG